MKKTAVQLLPLLLLLALCLCAGGGGDGTGLQGRVYPGGKQQ